MYFTRTHVYLSCIVVASQYKCQVYFTHVTYIWDIQIPHIYWSHLLWVHMSHVFCKYHISSIYTHTTYIMVAFSVRTHVTCFLLWVHISHHFGHISHIFCPALRADLYPHIQVCVHTMEGKAGRNLRPRRSDSSTKVGVFLSFVSEIPRKNAGVRNSSFRKPAAGAHTGVFGRVTDQRRAIEDDKRWKIERERERERERKSKRESVCGIREGGRERDRENEKEEKRKIQRQKERVREKASLHLSLLLALSLTLSRMFQVNRAHSWVCVRAWDSDKRGKRLHVRKFCVCLCAHLHVRVCVIVFWEGLVRIRSCDVYPHDERVKKPVHMQAYARSARQSKRQRVQVFGRDRGERARAHTGQPHNLYLRHEMGKEHTHTQTQDTHMHVHTHRQVGLHKYTCRHEQGQ